jgi:hypothetical protein
MNFKYFLLSIITTFSIDEILADTINTVNLGCVPIKENTREGFFLLDPQDTISYQTQCAIIIKKFEGPKRLSQDPYEFLEDAEGQIWITTVGTFLIVSGRLDFEKKFKNRVLPRLFLSLPDILAYAFLNRDLIKLNNRSPQEVLSAEELANLKKATKGFRYISEGAKIIGDILMLTQGQTDPLTSNGPIILQDLLTFVTMRILRHQQLKTNETVKKLPISGTTDAVSPLQEKHAQLEQKIFLLNPIEYFVLISELFLPFTIEIWSHLINRNRAYVKDYQLNYESMVKGNYFLTIPVPLSTLESVKTHPDSFKTKKPIMTPHGSHFL